MCAFQILPCWIMAIHSSINLDCVWTRFSRSNSNAVIDRYDEYLSVTNLSAGPRSPSLNDRIDRRLNELFIDSNLKLNLSAKVPGKIFGSISWSLTVLVPKPLTIHDRQSKDLNLAQGGFHRLKMMRLDNRND